MDIINKLHLFLKDSYQQLNDKNTNITLTDQLIIIVNETDKLLSKELLENFVNYLNSGENNLKNESIDRILDLFEVFSLYINYANAILKENSMKLAITIQDANIHNNYMKIFSAIETINDAIVNILLTWSTFPNENNSIDAYKILQNKDSTRCFSASITDIYKSTTEYMESLSEIKDLSEIAKKMSLIIQTLFEALIHWFAINPFWLPIDMINDNIYKNKSNDMELRYFSTKSIIEYYSEVYPVPIRTRQYFSNIMTLLCTTLSLADSKLSIKITEVLINILKNIKSIATVINKYLHSTKGLSVLIEKNFSYSLNKYSNDLHISLQTRLRTVLTVFLLKYVIPFEKIDDKIMLLLLECSSERINSLGDIEKIIISVSKEVIDKIDEFLQVLLPREELESLIKLAENTKIAINLKKLISNNEIQKITEIVENLKENEEKMIVVQTQIETVIKEWYINILSGNDNNKNQNIEIVTNNNSQSDKTDITNISELETLKSEESSNIKRRKKRSLSNIEINKSYVIEGSNNIDNLSLPSPQKLFVEENNSAILTSPKSINFLDQNEKKDNLSITDKHNLTLLENDNFKKHSNENSITKEYNENINNIKNSDMIPSNILPDPTGNLTVTSLNTTNFNTEKLTIDILPPGEPPPEIPKNDKENESNLLPTNNTNVTPLTEEVFTHSINQKHHRKVKKRKDSEKINITDNTLTNDSNTNLSEIVITPQAKKITDLNFLIENKSSDIDFQNLPNLQTLELQQPSDTSFDTHQQKKHKHRKSRSTSINNDNESQQNKQDSDINNKEQQTDVQSINKSLVGYPSRLRINTECNVSEIESDQNSIVNSKEIKKNDYEGKKIESSFLTNNINKLDEKAQPIGSTIETNENSLSEVNSRSQSNNNSKKNIIKNEKNKDEKLEIIINENNQSLHSSDSEKNEIEENETKKLIYDEETEKIGTDDTYNMIQHIISTPQRNINYEQSNHIEKSSVSDLNEMESSIINDDNYLKNMKIPNMNQSGLFPCNAPNNDFEEVQSTNESNLVSKKDIENAYGAFERINNKNEEKNNNQNNIGEISLKMETINLSQKNTSYITRETKAKKSFERRLEKMKVKYSPTLEEQITYASLKSVVNMKGSASLHFSQDGMQYNEPNPLFSSPLKQSYDKQLSVTKGIMVQINNGKTSPSIYKSKSNGINEKIRDKDLNDSKKLNKINDSQGKCISKNTANAAFMRLQEQAREQSEKLVKERKQIIEDELNYEKIKQEKLKRAINNSVDENFYTKMSTLPEQKKSLKLNENYFKPNINKKSEILTKKSTPEERMKRSLEKAELIKKQELERRKALELQNCTFTPVINKNVNVGDKVAIDKIAIEKWKEHNEFLEKKKEEIEKQIILSKCTFKPQLISKKVSEKLLKERSNKKIEINNTKQIEAQKQNLSIKPKISKKSLQLAEQYRKKQQLKEQLLKEQSKSNKQKDDNMKENDKNDKKMIKSNKKIEISKSYSSLDNMDSDFDSEKSLDDISQDEETNNQQKKNTEQNFTPNRYKGSKKTNPLIISLNDSTERPSSDMVVLDFLLSSKNENNLVDSLPKKKNESIDIEDATIAGVVKQIQNKYIYHSPTHGINGTNTGQTISIPKILATPLVQSSTQILVSSNNSTKQLIKTGEDIVFEEVEIFKSNMSLEENKSTYSESEYYYYDDDELDANAIDNETYNLNDGTKTKEMLTGYYSKFNDNKLIDIDKKGNLVLEKDYTILNNKQKQNITEGKNYGYYVESNYTKRNLQKGVQLPLNKMNEKAKNKAITKEMQQQKLRLVDRIVSSDTNFLSKKKEIKEILNSDSINAYVHRANINKAHADLEKLAELENKNKDSTDSYSSYSYYSDDSLSDQRKLQEENDLIVKNELLNLLNNRIY